MELGAKIAFIKESKHIPQIGTFPMFEIPTGNYDKGLGVGKVWYKVPLWVQKNIGHWLLDGGGGRNDRPANRVPQLPVWRIPGEIQLSASAGVGSGNLFPWARGLRRAADPSLDDDRPGRLLSFQTRPGEQLLFCYGHSVAGQTEQYAYIGMYWTWGKDNKKPDAAADWFRRPPGPTRAGLWTSGIRGGHTWKSRRTPCGP